jgi:hypothetical protein
LSVACLHAYLKGITPSKLHPYWAPSLLRILGFQDIGFFEGLLHCVAEPSGIKAVLRLGLDLDADLTGFVGEVRESVPNLEQLVRLRTRLESLGPAQGQGVAGSGAARDLHRRKAYAG